MKTIKLNLSDTEKQLLRKNGLKVSRLSEFAADEIAVILNAHPQRAKELYALINFQSIPSIGPKFAYDLMAIGCYTIDDVRDKNGPELFNELERKQGFWTDPCVEDQFWLVVDYAKNGPNNKNWWDFTVDRKTYRTQHGYPADRPVTAWHELVSSLLSAV